MITLTDEREKITWYEKVSNIVQYPFIMRALGSLEIEKNFLSLIEAVLANLKQKSCLMEKLPSGVRNQIELLANTVSVYVVPEDWPRERSVKVRSARKRSCYHLEITNVYKLPMRINRTGNKFQEKLPRK